MNKNFSHTRVPSPCADTSCIMPTQLLGYSVENFKEGNEKTVGDTGENVKSRNTLWKE